MNNNAIFHDANNLYEALQSATTTKERKSFYLTLRELITNNPVLETIFEVVETARLYTKKIVKRVLEALQPSKRVIWNDIKPIKDGVQQVYLIRLLDGNHELLYSKIGTTTRATQKRMTEHLRAYKKDGVQYVEVVRLWDCGNTEAESYESYFRHHYIEKHPGTFRKNDRFINVDFDYEEADTIYNGLKEGSR